MNRAIWWVRGVVSDAHAALRVARMFGWRYARREWRAQRELRRLFERNAAVIAGVLS